MTPAQSLGGRDPNPQDIKYVTLFFANFYPPTPCHTLPHLGTPKSTHTYQDPPIFNKPTTKTRTKAPLYKFSLNCSRAFLSGGLLSGRFCPGWFLSVPLLSECICYNRKLNITLNFMFHMQDKKIYKHDVTCSCPPAPLSQTVTHSRTPSPPRA